jgi:excisionase family DNA binding protein
LSSGFHPVMRELQPTRPPLLKRHYRLDEMAAYFTISARTVYRLLDEGNLQATQISGCVRMSTEEIRRFEEALTDADQY